VSFCLSSCFFSETTESTATLFGILQDEGGDKSSPEFMGRMLINISYKSCTSQWDLHLRFVPFTERTTSETVNDETFISLSCKLFTDTDQHHSHTRRINEN